MIRLRFLLRLYGGFGVVLILSTLVVWLAISHWIENDARDEIDHNLEARARLLMEAARPAFDGAPPPDFQDHVRDLGQSLDTRFTVVLPDGRVIADSHEDPDAMDNHGDRPEIRRALEEGIGRNTRFSSTLGTEMTYFCVALQRDGRNRGVVRAAFRTQVIADRLSRLRNALLGAGGLAALLTLLIGYYFARRMTAALEDLKEAAETIAAGGTSSLVPSGHGDELDELTSALSSMETRLRERLSLLRAERNKVVAVLAGIVEGVVAVDQDQRVLHLNQSCARMLGLELKDYAGRSLYELTRVPGIAEILRQVLQTGHASCSEATIATPSPGRILELQAAPLLSDRSDVTGAVLVMHDVTDLRRLETIRSDFVANVSHELKTPLAAIRGLVETMHDDPEMPLELRTSFLGKVRAQTQRLSALVSDLLVLSRLESGGGPVEEQVIDLRETALDARSKYSDEAEDRGMSLHFELDEVEAFVRADPENLRQVVDNLVSNALRYTPDGGSVTVRVHHEGGNVRLEVQDDGIGIEPTEQDRIFERFFRVDKARSAGKGGTGLGLAIVKHAVEGMGGQLFLQSQPGVGSTFGVRLPRVPAPSGSASEAAY